MADYIIVGGGIYGCTVAWQLAKRGADVLLLEANTIASGASGGLGERGVRANGRDLRELPLMHLAYDIWISLHADIGGFTGYRRLGHLDLIEREEDLARAPAQVWLQNQQGIESHLLDAVQLRELEPNLSESVIAAIYCPKDGVADHTATTRSMANAARAQGAAIQEHVRVTGLSRQGQRVVSLNADIQGEPTEIPVGKQVILLSNAHVAGFVESQLGLQLPIWRMLPQVMALRADIPPPMTHLIGHAHRTLAIKPLPDGRVMISGGWRGRWNATSGQGEPIAEQVEGNRLGGGRGLSGAGGFAGGRGLHRPRRDGLDRWDSHHRQSARRGEYAGRRWLVGARLGDCAGGREADGGVGLQWRAVPRAGAVLLSGSKFAYSPAGNVNTESTEETVSDATCGSY